MNYKHIAFMIVSGFQIFVACSEKPPEPSKHSGRVYSVSQKPRVKIDGLGDIRVDDSGLNELRTTDEFTFTSRKANSSEKLPTAIVVDTECEIFSQKKTSQTRIALQNRSAIRVMEVLPIEIFFDQKEITGREAPHLCKFGFQAYFDNKPSKYRQETKLITIVRSQDENTIGLRRGETETESKTDFSYVEDLQNTNALGFSGEQSGQIALRCNDFETQTTNFRSGMLVRDLFQESLTWVNSKWGNQDPRELVQYQTCRAIIRMNESVVGLSPFFDVYFRGPNLNIEKEPPSSVYLSLSERSWTVSETTVENLSLSDVAYLRFWPDAKDASFDFQVVGEAGSRGSRGGVRKQFDRVKRPITTDVDPASAVVRLGKNHYIKIPPQRKVTLRAKVSPKLKCQFQDHGIFFQLNSDRQLFMEVLTGPEDRLDQAPSSSRSAWVSARFTSNRPDKEFHYWARRENRANLSRPDLSDYRQENSACD